MTMPDEDLVPEPHLTPEDRDPEASPEDAAEQARLVDVDPDAEQPRSDEERLVGDLDEY